MSTLNEIKFGKLNYSDKAFEKTKSITLALSQIVMREMTEKERERVRDLAMIPDWT